MTEIDIRLSTKELHIAEDYLCQELLELLYVHKDKKTYNVIASLTTIINDLIHIREGNYQE